MSGEGRRRGGGDGGGGGSGRDSGTEHISPPDDPLQ